VSPGTKKNGAPRYNVGMGQQSQREEEEKIMDYVSSVFPTFLDGAIFAPARPDPPDFLEKREAKIGLEVTS
jgi:hypothetical protein